MGNKDYVSREQGELPHARAEIAQPVYIYTLWVALQAYKVHGMITTAWVMRSMLLLLRQKMSNPVIVVQSS